MKDLELKFSERLQVIRKRQGLTQAALGKKAGVSHMTVAGLERGQGFQTKTLLKVSKALGVSPGFLLGPWGIK